MDAAWVREADGERGSSFPEPEQLPGRGPGTGAGADVVSTRHPRCVGRSCPDSSALREACPSCHIICCGHRDHSFHGLKRSRKTDADVLSELARTVASWADSLG